MDNKKTQKQLELYLDVAVEMIMSRCDDAVTQNVNDQVRQMEEVVLFPEELDRRCREILKKTQRRSRYKYAGRALLRAGRMAAMLAVGILLLSGVLFATVEAVRAPILDLLVEKTPSHWFFRSHREAEADIPRDVIDPADPLKSLLPEGFALTEAQGNTVTKLYAAYENDRGDFVRISSLPKEEEPAPNWDGAESLNLCRINHYDVTLATKGRQVIACWYQEALDCCFTITAQGLSDEEVIKIVELVTSCLM